MFILLSLLCVSPCLYGKGMKSKPFVKWAGGKGQLIEQLDALLPRGFDSKNIVYVEPFVGGGAMLFYMLEKYPNISRAVINDMNSDLVTCYKVIKEKPEDLIEELRGLKKVLIVHGKGIHTHGNDPVLGELVRKFIERDKRCGTSGHPKMKSEGGTGVTWVILK